MITAPRNPSRRRSRPPRIAGDCEAMWSGSSAGYRACEAMTSGTPARMAARKGATLGGGGHGRVVGVAGGGAEAGEVLGRGRHAAGAVAAHRRGAQPRDLRRVAGVGAAGQRAAGPCGVEHRREHDVDALAAHLVGGRARRGVGQRRSALLRRCPRGRGEGHDAHRPALLVDADQRTAVGGALDAPGQAAQLARRADVVAEQDHARRAPLAQDVARVGGQRGAGEREDDRRPRELPEGHRRRMRARRGGARRALRRRGSAPAATGE